MRNLVELLVPRSDTWLPYSLAQQVIEIERQGLTSWFNNLQAKNLSFVADVDGLFDPYDELMWADYYVKLSVQALKSELILIEAKIGLVALNNNYEHDLDYIKDQLLPHVIPEFHIQCKREEGYELAKVAESHDNANRPSLPLISW